MQLISLEHPAGDNVEKFILFRRVFSECLGSNARDILGLAMPLFSWDVGFSQCIVTKSCFLFVIILS